MKIFLSRIKERNSRITVRLTNPLLLINLIDPRFAINII